VAGFTIGKRDGRWFVRAQGCCGDLGENEYARAHAVQVLNDGGRLQGWDAAGFELADRGGRLHRYPRSWRPASSSSSSGT
jgi:hypothetical protein